jgi:hypothetical protein
MKVIPDTVLHTKFDIYVFIAGSHYYYQQGFQIANLAIISFGFLLFLHCFFLE